MLKQKTITAPILDTIGAFTVDFGEFSNIISDPVSKAVSAAASGQPIITVADTAGFAVGQSVTIKDSAASESGTIITVTPAGPTITIGANLVNTYTAARGATVTSVSGVTLPVTGNAASGQATILMASTVGLAVGQLVRISDSQNSEIGWIGTVNANVSIVLSGGNLANSYTVARGATVTAAQLPGRALVSMSNFVPTTNLIWTVKYAVSQNQVSVIVNLGTVVDQANVVVWAAATSANVANCQFSVLADGE